LHSSKVVPLGAVAVTFASSLAIASPESLPATSAASADVMTAS
jgi:hypothetical protein